MSIGKLSLFSCHLNESCSKQRETRHLSVRRQYARSYGASDYSVDLGDEGFNTAWKEFFKVSSKELRTNILVSISNYLLIRDLE